MEYWIKAQLVNYFFKDLYSKTLNYNFKDVEVELKNQIKMLVEIGIKKFELIPYHKFGEQKYNMLGKKYELKIKHFDKEKIADLAKNLSEKYNIELKVSTPIIT